jgi:hypothetical protein
MDLDVLGQKIIRALALLDGSTFFPYLAGTQLLVSVS